MGRCFPVDQRLLVVVQHGELEELDSEPLLLRPEKISQINEAWLVGYIHVSQVLFYQSSYSGVVLIDLLVKTGDFLF